MALGLANVKLYVLTGSACILFPFKATKFHSPNRFCFMIPLKCSKRRYKKTFQSIGLFKIGTLFHIECQISHTILVKKLISCLVCIIILKEENWSPFNLFFIYIYICHESVFSQLVRRLLECSQAPYRIVLSQLPHSRTTCISLSTLVPLKV